MDAALELLKSGRPAVRVERDDLSVEHDRLFLPAPPLGERARNFRKLVRFLVAQARPQADGAAGRDFGDRADAVVFRLVDEPRVLERRVLERR